MRLCLKCSGLLVQRADDVVYCMICGHQYAGEMLAKIPMDKWDEIRNDRQTMIGNQRVTLDPDLMVFTEETVEI